MKSKHLLDPQMVPYLDRLPSLELGPDTLPAMRRWLEEKPSIAPSAPNVIVDEARVPGTRGQPDVRLLIYRPESQSGTLPCYFYCHGGGFVMGSADASGPHSRFIAKHINCVVISVDYRLSPDVAFPGPLEDCYAGLSWVHGNADRLRLDRERIAIGGPSAGGGLAAALALVARDRREVPVAFQLLIYPMLDDRTGSASEKDPNLYAGEYTWTPAHNRFGWSSMLGAEPGGPEVSPYASPARAQDLRGLPPTFIGVGALDLFVDEDIEFARRLMRAGVDTELHVYPGAVHGFDQFPNSSSKHAFETAYQEALRRALHDGHK